MLLITIFIDSSHIIAIYKFTTSITTSCDDASPHCLVFFGHQHKLINYSSKFFNII